MPPPLPRAAPSATWVREGVIFPACWWMLPGPERGWCAEPPMAREVGSCPTCWRLPPASPLESRVAGRLLLVAEEGVENPPAPVHVAIPLPPPQPLKVVEGDFPPHPEDAGVALTPHPEDAGVEVSDPAGDFPLPQEEPPSNLVEADEAAGLSAGS